MIEPFVTGFETDIEFERYVLEKAMPLVQGGQTGPGGITGIIYLDDRPSTRNIELRGGSTGLSAAQVVENLTLRPLMFGAAWKILDILIEHALRNVAGAKKRYKISEKVGKVSAGVVSVQPLASDPELWERVCGAYVGAEEYRHSIVHRRITTGPNGEFIGTDENGVPLRSLAGDEQIAFCRVVQRVAACVVNGDLPERERRAIGAELDRISALTRRPTRYGQAPAEVIPRITVPVASTVEIDMKEVKRKLYDNFARNPEIDVIFQLTDQADLSFLCHLEEAPDERLFFSDAASHSWLQRL